MSEMVNYTGRLKEIIPSGEDTLQDIARSLLTQLQIDEGVAYCDGNMLDWLQECRGDEYIVVDGRLFEIIDIEYDNTDDAFFKGSINQDGSISFNVQFHNGGCCLSEAIGEVLKKI